MVQRQIDDLPACTLTRLQTRAGLQNFAMGGGEWLAPPRSPPQPHSPPVGTESEELDARAKVRRGVRVRGQQQPASRRGGTPLCCNSTQVQPSCSPFHAGSGCVARRVFTW